VLDVSRQTTYIKGAVSQQSHPISLISFSNYSPLLAMELNFSEEITVNDKITAS